MSERAFPCQGGGIAGSVPTSLEKPEALVVWGVWHEVDGGITSVIVGNAQVA